MGVADPRPRCRCGTQEAAADIRGGLDVAVAVLVGIADIDEHERLLGVDALLDVRRALLGHHLPGLGQHLLERLHRWLLGVAICKISGFTIPPIPVGLPRPAGRPLFEARDKTAIIGRQMKGNLISLRRPWHAAPPITFTLGKQLVPVANKPILFYGIEALAASGIHEIGIVVGDTRRRSATPSATAPLRRHGHLHRAGGAARAGPRRARLASPSSAPIRSACTWATT